MENIKRVNVDGRRHYKVTLNNKEIGTFPSVTNILGETSDKSGLVKWKKRVGEKEAKRISTLSMNRGTVMHRLVEIYKPLNGSQQERLNELKDLSKTDKEITEFDTEFIHAGWEMFMKFWTNHDSFFDRIDEVLESEAFLWSKIGYAGTVDNVSKTKDGKILVIDYKNSRRPKKEEWVQDYYLQLASYYVAYWERTGIKANGAEIWIANEENSMPQTFELTQDDIKHYFKQFKNRLDKYNEKYLNI